MKNATKQYVMVARKGDLEPDTGKTVDVNGVYHAIHNTCPHEGGPLGEGEVQPPYFAERFEVRLEADR